MKILLKLMEPRSYSPCYSHGKYIALINCWVHFLYSYHSSLLTNYNSELPPLCQFWCTPTQRSIILQAHQSFGGYYKQCVKNRTSQNSVASPVFERIGNALEPL